jgi:hypothetical protein
VTITVKCKSFRPFEKNTLLGFADLEVPAAGLLIHDVCLHQKNGSTWVSLPGKPFQSSGETKWVPVVEFTDPPRKAEFQKAAVAAINDCRGLQE